MAVIRKPAVNMNKANEPKPGRGSVIDFAIQPSYIELAVQLTKTASQTSL